MLLEKLKSLFNNTTDTPKTEDIQLAAATLMFEVVRADEHIAELELSNMSTLLAKHFSLQQGQLSELVQSAQEKSEQAISLQGFTRQICEQWDNHSRCQLVESLWVIAIADGHIDAHERHIIRKIAALLYLNDQQIVQAKVRAQRQFANEQ